jgi:hypothetical protein
LKQSILDKFGKWIWTETTTTTRYRFWCEESKKEFKHILDKYGNILNNTDKTNITNIINGIDY